MRFALSEEAKEQWDTLKIPQSTTNQQWRYKFEAEHEYLVKAGVCDKSEVNFLLMRKQLTRTWETLVDCLADGKAPSKFNFYTYGDEGFGGEMDAPGQIAQCAANVLFQKTMNRDEWAGIRQPDLLQGLSEPWHTSPDLHRAPHPTYST